VYHDFAFLGAESIDAAVGARIAAADGKFEAYHRLVYANQQGENQGAFARPRLAQIAVAAGLDGPLFLRRLDDAALIAAVNAETARGRDLGVNSTPTLVVGGQMLRGSPTYPDLAALLVALGAPR
jgi:protein-disulfide isomerase